jgi:predicted nucleic acid-binding protein
MKYILIDTNIYSFCALLTKPDHNPDIIINLMGNILARGRAILILPEIVEIEYEKGEKALYDALIKQLKSLRDSTKGRMPENVRHERQEVVAVFDRLIAKRRSSRTAANRLIRRLFNSDNTIHLPITERILMMAYKRAMRRLKPYSGDDVVLGQSADCILIESAVEFFADKTDAELLICSDNHTDFAAAARGAGKDRLHEDIARDLKCEQRYYRSLVDLIEQEFSIEVPEEETSEYKAAVETVSTLLAPRTSSRAEEIVEDLMEGLVADLVDSDESVTGATAETNAYGWGLDVYYIDSAEFTSESEDEISFTATIELTGDQDEDKLYYGDQMTVQVQGKLKCDSMGWSVDDYEVIDVVKNVDSDIGDMRMEEEEESGVG